ncbi:hypothetical protein CTM70_10490 [Photobacterium phosphoreum]|uniref:hypothetical protein n=1 Tax=Photobacterium phosphoreum TaxID=659 RepID=UPI000D172C7F|nr:hypothetical protein [Photobacterium phosphoreum]PSW40664.1 hypothetical protein CTM70_10490 [Photobacterium phosphoreum]
MKKRTVIAIGIVILLGVAGGRDLYTTFYPQHMINIDGKRLHLGRVYSQHLLSTVVITGDDETLLTVTAPITAVVKQTTAKLKNEVNKGNRDLAVGEKMQLATAYFNADISIHLSTMVTYNAQHYASISMPLEAVTVNYTVNDELQFNDIIELVQRYQNKTQQIFNNDYNFIN